MMKSVKVLHEAVNNTIKNIETQLGRKTLGAAKKAIDLQIHGLFQRYLSFNEIIIELVRIIGPSNLEQLRGASHPFKDEDVLVEHFTKLVSMTVLGLGLLTANQIENAQGFLTDVSRKLALQRFRAVLYKGTSFDSNAPELQFNMSDEQWCARKAFLENASTDQEIICVAANEWAKIDFMGPFGLFGRDGSFFVKAMNTFLDKAKELPAQELHVELIPKPAVAVRARY
jgi:hypothetical protein